MRVLLITLCALLIGTFQSWSAYDYEVDGIYYNLYRCELEVTCGEKKYQQKEMVIPAHVTIDGWEFKVISIGPDAFRNNHFIKSVTLPNTIQFIRSNSFNGSFLESINLPESLWYIEEGAFEQCNLSKIDIPAGITTIEKNAFYLCIYLQAVRLPDTLRSIEEDAFSCTAITTITIPENVFSIGLHAFYNSNITEIYCLAPEPPHIRHPDGYVYGFPFDKDTYQTATLYVPNQYLDRYMNCDHWGRKNSFIPSEEDAYFRNIKGFDPDGIDDVTVDLDSKDAIEIYDIKGVKVPETILNLKNGIYIIRQGKNRKKLLVK